MTALQEQVIGRLRAQRRSQAAKLTNATLEQIERDPTLQAYALAAGASAFGDNCATCHGQRGPTLAGIWGQPRQLSDGRTVAADEAYMRESILYSTEKMVSGFQPIMPSYRGQMTEEQLIQIVAYIKSLSQPPTREVRPAHD